MATRAYPGELKLGSKGEDVKAVQAALPVQQTGEFGPTTEEKVKLFQGFHGLASDGVVGPLTWEALFPSQSFRSMVVATAQKYIGVKEEPMGSNRGRQVSYWQGLLGFDAQPWCAAFTYGVFQEVCAKLRMKNPHPVTGYCPAILDWARNSKRVTQSPQPGDIGLLNDPDYGAKHIYIVVKDNGNGTVSTVEGNAGDQVESLIRNKSASTYVSMSSESLDSSTVHAAPSTTQGSDKIV